MKTVIMTLTTASAVVAMAEIVGKADFTSDSAPMRPALHSSGWAPRSYPRYIVNDDAKIKAMKLEYARTHDWALINDGQRVIDNHFIFPLEDKDPKDPSNYYFEATDHLLSLSRNVGLKIFYRLGTSIEHTDGVHFNARMPKNFDTVAENFAATVRHYNCGWANGFKWGIEYWEIWNEPDGINNMWNRPGLSREDHMKEFAKFYAICLKRMKSEFGDTIKVGGPALCWCDERYFRCILDECKRVGTMPDFLSWHYYGQYPDEMLAPAAKMRKILDEEYKLPKCELINNEYHYILTWDGIHGRNSTPAMIKRAQEGPTGHNNIDSAAFMMTVLSRLQTSKYDQAYYYGCSHGGNWGYLDEYRMPTKIWYGQCMFGNVVEKYPVLRGVSVQGSVTTLAAESKDGMRKAVLVTDYRGLSRRIEVELVGVAAGVSFESTVLDYTHNALPCKVDRKGDLLRIVKDDDNSAVYLVEFEHHTSPKRLLNLHETRSIP